MITPQSEAKFWNEPNMVEYFASKSPDPRVIELLDAVDVHRAKGLDLGCGGGRHTQALAEAGMSTTALDLNPEMLTMSRGRTSHVSDRVRFCYGRIDQIPLQDDTFNFIVSTGVLHQVRNAVSLNNSIGEVARVAANKAVFIGNLFVSDIWDDSYVIPDPDFPEFVETREEVGMTLVKSEQVIEMFNRNGFSFLVDPNLDTKQENTGPRGVLRFSVERIRS